MNKFWLCFIALLVAVDAIGVLPVFMSLTGGFDRRSVRRIIWQSVLTALAVAMVFLAVGPNLLRLLHIERQDFMIAGGTLLFIISLAEILEYDHGRKRVDPETVGAVPLGVPLIVGPAVLTTSLLLIHEHGAFPAVAAVVVNVGLAGAVFWSSGHIYRILGKAGTKTVSKLASLLLAAIGVMIVRSGIAIYLQHPPRP